MVEGFQRVGGTTWVHPRDRIGRVLEAADGVEMFVFRGTLEVPRGLAAVRLWALDAVASRYRMFLRRYTPLTKRKLPPFDAFVARHAMMSEFFRITWSDPGLPPEILPPHWPGGEAKRLARTLYERLLPAATQYADRVFDEVSKAR
jgi:phenylacetic acid degradation operon negative regulatory protein